jgi:death-on-curing protein
VSVEYVELPEYVAIAAEVGELDVETIVCLPGLPLAESALHAPKAGFGDYELYPDFVDKAAVLLTRLVGNHPLPDGNKRAAWVALRLFVEINGWSWRPMPSVGDAEQAVLGIADGSRNQEDTATWLRGHLAAPA